MKVEKQILEFLKTEQPEMYNKYLQRANEVNDADKVKKKEEKKLINQTKHVTKFRMMSKFTTKKKLQELEDIGFETLYNTLQNCKGNQQRDGEWLYIPEMVHVLLAMHYNKPDIYKLDTNEMKAILFESKCIRNKKNGIDLLAYK